MTIREGDTRVLPCGTCDKLTEHFWFPANGEQPSVWSCNGCAELQWKHMSDKIVAVMK